MSCSKCEAEKQRKILHEQKKRELEKYIQENYKSPLPAKTPSLWNRFKFLVRGAFGMFKYATKISKRTSGNHIKHRQRLCESCPIYDFGICDKDLGGCGCVLYYKIRVEKEKCPKGKWGPVEGVE